MRFIDWSHQSITVLNAAICGFENLNTLIVANNHLSYLDQEFAQCAKLQTFDLSFNNLTANGLPSSLGKMRSLQSLNLQHNPLQRVPEFICSLPNLKALNLSDCGLTSLPACMANISSLQYLDISRNPISSLPDWFGQLTSLRYLLLSDTPLNQSISELSKLTRLKCVQNFSAQLNLVCGVHCEGFPLVKSSTLNTTIFLNSTDSGQIRSSISSTYSPLSSCSWTVQAPIGRQIRGSFTTFDLESPYKQGVFLCADSVEVHDGSSRLSPLLPFLRQGKAQQPAQSLCGSRSPFKQTSDYRTPQPTDIFLSSSNSLTLVFRSDNSREGQGIEFDFSVL